MLPQPGVLQVRYGSECPFQWWYLSGSSGGVYIWSVTPTCIPSDITIAYNANQATPVTGTAYGSP